jgi:hypothetical protein
MSAVPEVLTAMPVINAQWCEQVRCRMRNLIAPLTKARRRNAAR